MIEFKSIDRCSNHQNMQWDKVKNNDALVDEIKRKNFVAQSFGHFQNKKVLL